MYGMLTFPATNSDVMTERRVCKDRQQEARAVLVALHCIGDACVSVEVYYMYYISLITLLYGLFIDIKHVQITWSETKSAYSK